MALGGRVLPGSSDPAKYKNSIETPIYSKRRTLYALNWAKQDIIKSEEVVVCEGYTDVIGLFEAGVERAVATCGTALAEEHVKLLRGFASRVVLAFDADGAGQSAAGRFYEWERRLSMDVAVAALPLGSDPGEMARTDPDGLRAAIEGAKPFLQFRVERILDAAELSTPEGRAKAADAALAAVAEHPDNLVRDQYLMQVAERCRLEPLLLRDRLEQLRQEGPRKAPGGGRPRAVPGRRRRERAGPPAGARDEQWVREPDDGDWDADGFDGGGVPRRAAPAAVQRGIGRPSGRPASSVPGSRPCAWPSTGRTMSATAWRPPCSATSCSGRPSWSLAEADPDAELHQVIASAPPQVRALLVRLTVEEPVGEPDDVVLQLVRDAARGELQVITAEARTSPEAAEEAAAASAWVQELDDPAASVAATARLVAWLVVRAQKDTSGRGS